MAKSLEFIRWDGGQSFQEDVKPISLGFGLKRNGMSSAQLKMPSNSCKVNDNDLVNFRLWAAITFGDISWEGPMIDQTDDGDILSVTFGDMSAYPAAAPFLGGLYQGEGTSILKKMFLACFEESAMQYHLQESGVAYDRLWGSNTNYVLDAINDVSRAGVDWFVLNRNLVSRETPTSASEVELTFEPTDFRANPTKQEQGTIQAQRIIVNGAPDSGNATQVIVEEDSLYASYYGFGQMLKHPLTKILNQSGTSSVPALTAIANRELELRKRPTLFNLSGGVALSDTCKVDVKKLRPGAVCEIKTDWVKGKAQRNLFLLESVDFDFKSEAVTVAFSPLGGMSSG